MLATSGDACGRILVAVTLVKVAIYGFEVMPEAIEALHGRFQQLGAITEKATVPTDLVGGHPGIAAGLAIQARITLIWL